MSSFTSYIQPSPPKLILDAKKKQITASKILNRVSTAIYEFVKQSSEIRTASLRESDTGKSSQLWERVISCGLAWGRNLLDSDLALGIRDDVSDQSIHVAQGRFSKRRFTLALNTIGHLRAEFPHLLNEKRQRIWYNGTTLIVAFTIQHLDRDYFCYFYPINKLSQTDIRLFGTFMRVFEETLNGAIDIELLVDRRRLLNRRTILAQLRPNDLLYQSLKRLHKHINWKRSALVLAPHSLEAHHDPQYVDNWHVIAERLWEVHSTSLRIGKSYRLKPADAEHFKIDDLIIESIGRKVTKPLDPWAALIAGIVADDKDLPHDLPHARSALAVCIPVYNSDTPAHKAPEEGNGRPLFVVLLTDPREKFFTKQHIQLTRSLFSDIGHLVHRSNQVSQRLVNLWHPVENIRSEVEPAAKQPEVVLHTEQADEVEALDITVLPQDAPNVLSVDALQVIQLRRGRASKASTGRIDLLHLLAFKQSTPPLQKEGAELVTGLNPKCKVTPNADLLWKVLVEGQECTQKNSRGLAPKRVANLFSSSRSTAIYKSVLIVPIYSEREISGALISYRRNPSEFADVDKLLIRSLAARIGERIELHRQLADRARHNTCLTQVAQAENPAQARLELVKGARELLGADHAFMMAAEELSVPADEQVNLKITDVAHTWPSHRMRIPPIEAGREGITGEVFTSGEHLAIEDVSAFKSYVPLRDVNNKIVTMASELAVPIKAPVSVSNFSSGDAKQQVFGVLDAMWEQKHTISKREIRTLNALARHAAAVLQLTTSLQDTKQTRDRLHELLDRVRILQGLGTEKAVLAWLWSLISEIISCDAIYVWSHARGDNYIKLFYSRGRGTKNLSKNQDLSYEDSWNGQLIKQYRESGIKSAHDTHDRPSLGIHIPNTRIEDHEARLAYCVIPSLKNEGDGDHPEEVWSVCLYRFHPSNFDIGDRSLLQLASEYIEGAVQNIRAQDAQARTIRLAAANTEIALRLVDEVRSAPDRLVKYILRRTKEELSAYTASVLYYHHIGGSHATPTHFDYPSDFSNSPSPRIGGISEAVRERGSTVIISDLKHPPAWIKQAIKTSPFLQKNPRIGSMVAYPLFEYPDIKAPEQKRFCGVLFVNFIGNRIITNEELTFLNTVQRFLIECGGLGALLTRMRENSLQQIQTISIPSQVFDEILKVALKAIKAELPSNIVQSGGFRLCGNIYMIEAGDNWALLSVRASVGERSGEQSGRQYIGEGVVGKVASKGDAVIVNDTTQPATDYKYLEYFTGMRSELAVPIKTDEMTASLGPEVASGVIGVLNIECSHPNIFTSRHQDLLTRYISETPVSLILKLAERHGVLLWKERSSTDRFVNEAAAWILHDLTKPIRRVDKKVGYIRSILGRPPHTPYLAMIESALRELEQESRRWTKLKDTGFLHLQPEILEARHPVDIIEQLNAWASLYKNNLHIEPHSINEFFIQKGHESLIAQVLENLLHNSQDAFRKAGIAKGKIWLELGLSEMIGHFQYLNVNFNDNGPGFDNADDVRSRIFRFRRPSSEGGWGMGLPCTSQMMKSMIGEIDLISSVPNVKTTFQLRFLRSTLGFRVSDVASIN